MLRMLLAGALASGALLGGSAASAHDYGRGGHGYGAQPGGYGSFGYGGGYGGGGVYVGGGASYGGGYGAGYGGGYGASYGGGYGYDAGTPAYASGGGGYGYAPYRPRGFTLLGARAGITVLGVDVDASAKLTVGAHGWGGGYAPRAYAQPAPVAYAPPEPVYAPSYAPPAYYPQMSYGYCGC